MPARVSTGDRDAVLRPTDTVVRGRSDTGELSLRVAVTANAVYANVLSA